MRKTLFEDYELIVNRTASQLESEMGGHDYSGWVKNTLTVLFVNWVFTRQLESQDELVHGLINEEKTNKMLGNYQAFSDVLEKFKELQK